MRFKDSLKIDGSFSGEIVSTGFLYIEQGASITANIRVGSVVVGGTVKGNIEATEKLEMLVHGQGLRQHPHGQAEDRRRRRLRGQVRDDQESPGRQRLLRTRRPAEEKRPECVTGISPRGGIEKTAVIISAGTELTEGIIQDAHVRYIASELTSLGFAVRRGVQVPDDMTLFRAELARAVAESRLVIITGGLGPTSDDLTREIVAEAAGVPLDFHQEAWDALLARFPGRTVSDTNRKQALAPRGFRAAPEPQRHGARASRGRWARRWSSRFPVRRQSCVRCSPASVLPLVARAFRGRGGDRGALGHRPHGAGIEPRRGLAHGQRGTPCRESGGAHAWTRTGSSSASAAARPTNDDALFERPGRSGWARCASAAGRPARPSSSPTRSCRGMRGLSVAESCTGGLIGKYMTDLPGSSRVFWGGFLVYSNEAKTRLLGVEETACCRSTARSRRRRSSPWRRARVDGLRRGDAVNRRFGNCRAGGRHAGKAGRHDLDRRGAAGRPAARRGSSTSREPGT